MSTHFRWRRRGSYLMSCQHREGRQGTGHHGRSRVASWSSSHVLSVIFPRRLHFVTTLHQLCSEPFSVKNIKISRSFSRKTQSRKRFTSYFLLRITEYYLLTASARLFPVTTSHSHKHHTLLGKDRERRARYILPRLFAAY